MLHRMLSLALLCLALPACDSGGDEDGDGAGPDVDCDAVTAPKFSEMTAWSKCTNCHASTLTDSARAGAPVGIDFDQVEPARTWSEQAMHEVYEGEMPLPGSPALTEAEKTQIYNWASCGTPN